MSAGKILIGSVIAMAMGAVLGVLFAPGKGSATRNQLSQQDTRYTGALENIAGEFLGPLEKKYESVKEAGVGLPGKVAGAVSFSSPLNEFTPVSPSLL